MLSTTQALALGAKGQNFNAGVRSLGYWHDESGEKLELVVWYPSHRSSSFSAISEWKVTGVNNAAILPGRYPVILLSHDKGTNRFFNHDLAGALARQGFIVIAPTHTGDSLNDASDMYSAETLYRRPRQLLLALEVVKNDHLLGQSLDESRIGILGVGTGSTTAMQLSEIRIDPNGFDKYCLTASKKDVFCSEWANKMVHAIPKQMQGIEATKGKNAFTPDLYVMRSHFTSGAKSTEKKAKTTEPTNNMRKIRALGLLAPGGTMAFSQEALSAIKVPVGIVLAGNDEVYPVDIQGQALANRLPSPPYDPTDMLVLAGADHYSLNATCPKELSFSLPSICGYLEEKKRTKFATQRDDFFIRFFKAYLGSPLPPEEIHLEPEVVKTTESETPDSNVNDSKNEQATKTTENSKKGKQTTTNQARSNKPKPNKPQR